MWQRGKGSSDSLTFSCEMDETVFMPNPSGMVHWRSNFIDWWFLEERNKINTPQHIRGILWLVLPDFTESNRSVGKILISALQHSMSTQPAILPKDDVKKTHQMWKLFCAAVITTTRTAGRFSTTRNDVQRCSTVGNILRSSLTLHLKDIVCCTDPIVHRNVGVSYSCNSHTLTSVPQPILTG